MCKLLCDWSPSEAAIKLIKLNGVDEEQLLKTLGYTVLTAVNGKKSLSIISSSQTIDMVLLDIFLPDYNGFDLLPEMLAIQPDLKIVFSTGNPLEESEESLHEKGAVGFLQKPYSTSALKKTLNRVLN